MEARAVPQQVSSRIIRDPRILGGEPTVKGTRIPVWSIVVTHRYYGDTEQVCRAYPMLDRAAVEEALAYYKVNAEEIDRSITENGAEVD